MKPTHKETNRLRHSSYILSARLAEESLQGADRKRTGRPYGGWYIPFHGVHPTPAQKRWNNSTPNVGKPFLRHGKARTL